jgi:hypothetical protein
MLSYPRSLARLGISCGVMAAMSQSSTAPVKSVFGIYGQPGHDRIQVTEKPNGLIGVNLKLYFANGHTCQLNKDGNWSEDHVAIVAEGLDANRQCKLNLFFEKSRVLLKDEGLLCAPVYCGTRGKLDGMNLPKYERKP